MVVGGLSAHWQNPMARRRGRGYARGSVSPEQTYSNPERKNETGVPLRQHLTRNDSTTYSSCSLFFSVYASKYLILSHRSLRQPLRFQKEEVSHSHISPQASLASSHTFGITNQKCNALLAKFQITPSVSTNMIYNFLIFLSLAYISLHQDTTRPSIFLKIRRCRQPRAEIYPDSSKNMVLLVKT